MFDIEFMVPFCSKFAQRIKDFKKYGLVNAQDRSVMVSVLVSNESIEGLESGWHEGFKINVVECESPNYIGNLYRFYLDLDPSSPRARWLVRLDDDSCTDVDGLVSNLDYFYDADAPFYLGDLNRFHAARCGGEHGPYTHYRSLLGRYDPIIDLMRNEVECGVMSHAALKKVLTHQPSRNLLQKRASLEGGFGDCLTAVASAMAKVWPIDCPFLTHRPHLHEFSLLGGVKNHIHQISRIPEGENFWGRAEVESYMLLTKVIDNAPTEAEKTLTGKRFLLESENMMKIIEFGERHRAKVKLEDKLFHWYEHNGEVLLLESGATIHRFRFEGPASLSCEGMSVRCI